ncbi:hypothetical protein [Algirhabdus cladophorae]|uniref:hypothetical protein n=1 Tax=Algirhabdus cladophorae TaxID=3377108 RepID=UPI003B849655
MRARWPKVFRSFSAIGVALLGATFAQASSLQELQARGTLRACFAEIDPVLINVQPAGCIQDCQVSGLLVDQVQIFADQLGGLSVDPKIVEWSAQFADAEGNVTLDQSYLPELLADGTCDLYASNLARLPWRMSKLQIIPLYESRMIAIVRADRVSEFETLQDFAGMRVASVENSSFHSWLLARNQDVFAQNPVDIIFDQESDSFEDVLKGAADFTLTDADIAVLTMRAYGDSLVPAFAVGPLQMLGWGVDPNSTELIEQIERFFTRQRLTPRSALNQAWETHLGVNIAEFERLIESLPGSDAPE